MLYALSIHVNFPKQTNAIMMLALTAGAHTCRTAKCACAAYVVSVTQHAYVMLICALQSGAVNPLDVDSQSLSASGSAPSSSGCPPQVGRFMNNLPSTYAHATSLRVTRVRVKECNQRKHS